MQPYIKKVILIFVPCYAVILLALTWLLITKRITSFQFGIVGGAIYVVGFVTLFILFRRAKKRFPEPQKLDAAAIQRLRRSVKAMRIYVVYFVCSFVYAAWATRYAPLLRRLAGAAIAIFFIGVFVRSIQQARKRIAAAEVETSSHSQLPTDLPTDSIS